MLNVNPIHPDRTAPAVQAPGRRAAHGRFIWQGCQVAAKRLHSYSIHTKLRYITRLRLD